MKINEILNEMGVGGVASVAMPMGAVIRRAPGSPPKKKKKKTTEAEHPECTVCNGSGIDRAENACKACDGSGHKLTEAKGKKEPRDPDEIWRDMQHARIPPENRCPACDGMAGTYGLWSAPCRVCQGSGRKDMKGITKITPTSEGKKRKSAFSNVTRDKNAPKAAPNLAAKHASSVIGGGAAGAHASKKDKANRPDRKQKHKGKGIDEGKAQNFTGDDLNRLSRIRDLGAMKEKAMELISNDNGHPMKPEKVEWFRNVIDQMNSPDKVIKLMYDLLLSGEGHGVVGSKGTMAKNSYRKAFDEADEARKKKGPVDSTSRGWEKAAKKNTHKKRRQAGKKEVNEGGSSHTMTNYLGNDAEVTVQFKYYKGRPQTQVDPAEDAEIELIAVLDKRGNDITRRLTDSTLNRLENDIKTDYDFSDDGRGDYEYDLRKDDRSMEEAKTKKVPHALAKTKAPKGKKPPKKGNTSPHPMRGKFVGGN